MEAESKTYKGHNISIHFDECDESPREWDNICVIHMAHRNYNFGDENHNSLESIKQAEEEALENGDIVLPLYMLDHSGVTISLSPFSCFWDSGKVGFVQIPKKKMLKEFNKKIFSKKLKERALEIAKYEVDTLDKFIRGEVYGYIIDEDGDSCWGYYSVEEAIKEAEGIIDTIVKEDKKKHFNNLKTWIKNKVPFYARQSISDVLIV